ncbi:hypothetical protein TNCV_3300921 [Trichonephila clavipes]|nr:hypothetical protein TNCV_3300921 [Trichonephila clavipes]
MVDLDGNISELAVRQLRSSAGFALPFLRAHDDKYWSSALVVVQSRPWLKFLEAEFLVRYCCHKVYESQIDSYSAILKFLSDFVLSLFFPSQFFGQMMPGGHSYNFSFEFLMHAEKIAALL